MSESNGLILCDLTFLDNFNRDWLSNFTFTEYKDVFGTKNTLENILAEQFKAVFVDQQCSYVRNHFICWLRVLEPEGILCVEAKENETPEQWVRALSHQVSYVEQENKNVWLFIKNQLKFPASIENKDEYSQHIFRTIALQIEKNKVNYAVDNLLAWEVMDSHNYNICFLLANLLHSLGQDEEANAVMTNYVQRVPHDQMRFLRILDYLATGDYPLGFKMRYDINIEHSARTRLVPTEQQLLRRWQGQSIAGKSFVIWTEFGLGDEIMFSQLAYYLKLQGVKKVIMIAQSPIVTLLQSHPDIDLVVDYHQVEEMLPEFDYWSYPHDILAFVDLPFPQLPKRHPYLFADEKNIQKFQSRIKLTSNLKVGIAWRGDPKHENDYFRSIHNLEYIRQLLALPNIDWYCLQKVCNENELSLLNEFAVPHIVADCQDMAETAAIISQLDYVVAVDTSVLHVAGALGVQAVALLPYVVDWRWGYKDRSNLWYPSIYLLRNPMPLSYWDTLIENLKNLLYVKATTKQMGLMNKE